MLETLRNAWKVDEIRKKLIFTLAMLVIFRLGNAIPVPFVDTTIVSQIFEATGGGFLSLVNLFSGGALQQFSIFALSIYPYITSSIIIQLLTVAIPHLEELSKEGEAGRKKIQQYTKYLAILLAIFQAIAITNMLFSNAIVAQGPFERAAITIVLVAGHMFLVWLADLITEKGIGNGTSMLIFTGIISRLPVTFITWVQSVMAGQINPIIFILVIAIMILIVLGVVLITQGERRVNVQYAKRVVGRKMYGGQSTHIPIKVNMSGVMPIIFTSSILSLPYMIAGFMGENAVSTVSRWFSNQGAWQGALIYNILAVVMIIFFAYFYNAMQFNTVEYAKNLQQQGGFIPGIRPGRPTSEHLDKIVTRITLVGAIALAILYVLPTILSAIFNLNIDFGGTSIIIVVGVVLDIVQELESMLLMRHYKGFLNR